jgi:hypothetical protein
MGAGATAGACGGSAAGGAGLAGAEPLSLKSCSSWVFMVRSNRFCL